MSSHPEHDDALPLPHANLLAYLRLSTLKPQELSDKETAPPPYTEDKTTHPHGVGGGEEAHCGFRNRPDAYASSRSMPSIWHDSVFVFLAACFVASIIALIGGMIGLVYSASPSVISTGIMKYDMRFCLASPNRQAPGPQMWRYVNTAGVKDCATEVLTLSARSTEIWKMRYGDEMSLGEEIWQKKKEKHGGVEDMGDDVATGGGDRAFDVLPVYKRD